MIQGVLILPLQPLTTQTLTTRLWTTWAGWTGRTPSGATSTPPGSQKLLHPPILVRQTLIATPLLQTNTRVVATPVTTTPVITTPVVTTPVQISWELGSITTCQELLSTPGPPGPRALSWTGS